MTGLSEMYTYNKTMTESNYCIIFLGVSLVIEFEIKTFYLEFLSPYPGILAPIIYRSTVKLLTGKVSLVQSKKNDNMQLNSVYNFFIFYRLSVLTTISPDVRSRCGPRWWPR